MLLRLLGPVSLRDDLGQDVHRDLTQPKRVALLGYLAAAEAGTLVRRDTLLALFWPELPERDARNALNQAVHYLRTMVGADALLSGGAEALGVDPAAVRCDVRDFDAAMRERRFADAVALYRGPFMEGFNLAGLPEFEDWVARERSTRARLAADAAWSLAESEAADPQEALRRATDAHAILPDEGATRRLLALHDRLGDRAGAIHIYEAFAKRLDDDYGAAPAPETQALIRDIRNRSEPARPGPEGLSPSAANNRPRSEARRSVRASFIAAGIAVLAVASLLVASRARNVSGTGDEARVLAVLPFEYRGAPALSYLGEGVASLLSSSLNGAGKIRTVDPHAFFLAVSSRSEAYKSPDEAHALARQFGAGIVVVGDIVESGGRLRISAALSDGLSGENRVVAEGEAERLFDVVDDLAAKLLTIRGTAGDARHTASITTHSLPALRAYLAGSAEYRAGRYQAAVQSLRRAVDADSTFALAQYLLSLAANWTGKGATSDRAAMAAMRYRDRLTPRDRAKVEAIDVQRRGPTDSAFAVYERLVAGDATDVDPLFQLADLHFHHGSSYGLPPSASGAEWARVIALDPANAGALLHAARVAAMAHERQRFDSLAARLDRLEIDPDRAAEVEVMRAFAFGDRAARASALSRLDRSSSVFRDVFESVPAWSRTLADVDELVYPRMLHWSLESREDGVMLMRAQIELARGKLKAAAATIDTTARIHAVHAQEFRALFAVIPNSATSAAERRRIAADYAAMPVTAERRGRMLRHYLLALLALRDGDAALARVHRAALDTAPVQLWRTEDPAYTQRLAGIVGAELRRAAGDNAGALELLGPPRDPPDRRVPHVWTYPIAHERFLRAELAAALGRFDEAQRWYATFPERTHDLMFYPAVLQRSGELFARAGDHRRAAERYETLLALWASADASMQPRIQDIRRRLGQ